MVSYIYLYFINKCLRENIIYLMKLKGVQDLIVNIQYQEVIKTLDYCACAALKLAFIVVINGIKFI